MAHIAMLNSEVMDFYVTNLINQFIIGIPTTQMHLRGENDLGLVLLPEVDQLSLGCIMSNLKSATKAPLHASCTYEQYWRQNSSLSDTISN